MEIIFRRDFISQMIGRFTLSVSIGLPARTPSVLAVNISSNIHNDPICSKKAAKNKPLDLPIKQEEA